ncbi:Putative protein kinase-like domain superfamily [Colletotrichum destructivum]|uniref:Protein kinase domain-containing protein n=1 Tax=Colletotrichum destructivum TaxID=34406 RepID=A0AAX4ITU3_9PEZI|nr:Putative protein kinase-like domain superfamily [Colletotrichum destructivum]
MEEEYTFHLGSKQFTAFGQSVFLPPDLHYTKVLKLSQDTDWTLLPKRIVAKKEDCKYRHLFDSEIRVYEHLQDLQGSAIPIMYGLGTIDGDRALVMSDIGGTALIEEETPRMENSQLEAKLVPVLRQIRSQGVRLQDLSSLNVHLCEGEIRIVDFEAAEILVGDQDDEESDMAGQVQDLVDFYERRRKGLEAIAKPHNRRKRHSRRPRTHGRNERLDGAVKPSSATAVTK